MPYVPKLLSTSLYLMVLALVGQGCTTTNAEYCELRSECPAVHACQENVCVEMTAILAPPARENGAMVYDPRIQKVLLFGGDEGGVPHNDTWAWDGEAWELLHAGGTNAPPPRFSHAMAYDQARSQVLLFGGENHEHLLFGDTWIWTGVGWTKLSPAVNPPARRGHGMAHDRAQDRIVMFGGNGRGDVDLDDTWTWNGSTWLQRQTAPSPASQDTPIMYYDGLRSQVVLMRNNGAGGALWEWNGEQWISRQEGSAPIRRARAAAVHEATRSRAVYFGGTTIRNGSSRFDDTWLWSGAGWTQATPVQKPLARHSHVLVYDHARDNILLFGGSGEAGTLGDTWIFENDQWTDRSFEVEAGSED